jgi:uncharacterized ParB-like nuclease family protein
MAGAAERHKIYNKVFGFGSTHSPAIDMMDVNRPIPTNLAWNKVIHAISEMIKVDLCVLLQRIAKLKIYKPVEGIRQNNIRQ